jgi:hypothetical protein
MHSTNTIRTALPLASQGANASEIARHLGIPRTITRDWLRGCLPRDIVLALEGADICGRCGHPGHVHADLPGAHVYLLGLYLGDGGISQYRRDVYRLRINLDVMYPAIAGSAAEAITKVRPGPVLQQLRP